MESFTEASFQRARELILNHGQFRDGIGTLGEKTTHAILKYTCAPDPSLHEIPVAGSIADICTGREIIEIQTGGFHPLKKKLDKFLPLMPVTIVHPIPRCKWLCWIDPETGETTGKRKSPKTGSPLEIFRQLIYLLPYLNHPNLRIFVVMLDMEEYRLLDGWSRDKKKGSHRYDRIPLSIAGEVRLDCPRDYMQLIPWPLQEPFTLKDFEKAAGISHKTAENALLVLRRLNLIVRQGKSGNAYLYEIPELMSENTGS